MTTTEKKKLVVSAAAHLNSARNDVQELRDAVDEQFENLSAKQQEGDKGAELTHLVDTLDDAIGQIEEAQGNVEGIEW